MCSRRELKAIELVWEGVAEVTTTYLHSVVGNDAEIRSEAEVLTSGESYRLAIG